MNDPRTQETGPLRSRADLAAAAAAVAMGGFVVGALLPTYALPSRLVRVAIGLAVVAGATALLGLGSSLARPVGRALWRVARAGASLACARYRPRRGLGPRARRWIVLVNVVVAISVFALSRSAASMFEALSFAATLAFAAAAAAAALVATNLLLVALRLGAERRLARALEVAAGLALLAVAPALSEQGAYSDDPQPAGGVASALPSDPPHREPHAIRSFSYGPGDDARPPYGRDARVLTARVDLSGVVPEGWSSRRTSYWGFDPARLPVAGKAWVPLGVSGAPLVLLMHGTHDMRVASEDGLAYLAEALSARGFAAATIDVNFLGYGGRAGELQGSDIQARAALVVAHLEAWHAMVAASASPLHRAVDLQRVLLVGHSRGGEAIALAASLLSNGAARGRYRVRALAALAPTENEGPAWFDASYLTIHGDADNDVEAFVGLRAYHRLRVGSAGGDRGEDRGALVKSAVLVQGANHSQFNEAWGRSDKTWPASLLERRANLLPAWKQRRVTAALVTAFTEAALLGSARGRDVLRDARRVAADDAGVRVKAKYQDAASELLAAFDEDQDPSTGTTDGSKIDAQGFDRWSELDPPLRLPEHFGTRMNRALELMWGRRPRATAPRLTIALPQAAAGDLRAGGSIAFNVAYPAEPPRIEVRVVDAAGLAARVPLDEHFPLEPLRRTRLSILELLERPTAQTLLETASVPLSAFTAREPRLDLGSIRTVELVFRSASGTVRIDDVQLWRGASPAPGPP